MDFIQQHIFRKLSRNQKREIEAYMIIKGKIVTSVVLSDINKRVDLGKEVSLTEQEVNKSNDLQNAIRRGWVEIIQDRSMLLRALQGTSSVPNQKINETDILDLAKKMANTMAEEMIKNSPLVKEMAKEIAKEMIVGFKDNLNITVQGGNGSNEKQQQKTNTPESSIFVDFKDEEVGLKANMNNVGTIEVQKDDLAGSVEKMKKFKRGKQQ